MLSHYSPQIEEEELGFVYPIDFLGAFWLSGPDWVSCYLNLIPEIEVLLQCPLHNSQFFY